MSVLKLLIHQSYDPPTPQDSESIDTDTDIITPPLLDLNFQ